LNQNGIKRESKQEHLKKTWLKNVYNY